MKWLKALAVTIATRSPLLPDVVNKLNAAINRAMASADVVKRFGQLGMASNSNTTTEFNNFLKAEVPKWAAVVKSSGAKVD